MVHSKKIFFLKKKMNWMSWTAVSYSVCIYSETVSFVWGVLCLSQRITFKGSFYFVSRRDSVQGRGLGL